jgi:hypothetical protein
MDQPQQHESTFCWEYYDAKKDKDGTSRYLQINTKLTTGRLSCDLFHAISNTFL